MFCEMCGKQLENGTSFCPYCGYKIQAPDSDTNGLQVVGGQDYSLEGYDAQPIKKKSGGKIAAIIALAAVLVAGVGFGIFWFVTDGELFNKEAAQQAAQSGEVSETTQIPAGSPSATTLSPDTTQVDRICYVNVETVTLYKGPDASVYKAVCTASKDDTLTVKGTHSSYPEWIYVYSSRTNDYGWISSALVSEQKASEIPTTDFNSNTEVMYYDVAARFDVMIDVGEGHNLNLRRQPDTTDPENVIILIPDKAYATVLGVSSKDTLWYYVEYTDGFATYYGYIHSDHTIRYY